MREVAEVESMTAAMARISRNFDRLKALRDRDWRGAPTDPDVVSHRVALLVAEDFTESSRNLSGDYDAEFRELLEAAAGVASRLTDSLREENSQRAGDDLLKLGQSCSACHADYRN